MRWKRKWGGEKPFIHGIQRVHIQRTHTRRRHLTVHAPRVHIQFAFTQVCVPSVYISNVKTYSLYVSSVLFTTTSIHGSVNRKVNGNQWKTHEWEKFWMWLLGCKDVNSFLGRRVMSDCSIKLLNCERTALQDFRKPQYMETLSGQLPCRLAT